MLRSSRKGLGSIEESVAPKGFLLFRARMDDTDAPQVRQVESSRGMGFGVMRSPDRGQSKLAEGSQAWRFWIDHADAPMLRLREAEKLANSNRVGLASPSTAHQEAEYAQNTGNS